MNEYARPVFSGVSGVVRSHDMGDQPTWDSGERFRPVGAVAQALIEHVDREYDVVIDAPVALPPTHARGLGHDVSRIVRISSGRSGEVTVWLAFGAAPGVISVFAGLFSQFDMWFCGCDMCDGTWQGVADALEEVFLLLARGGVAESLEPGRSGRARWSLTSSSMDWSGVMPLKGVRRRQQRHWGEQLSQLADGRWSGWTPRLQSRDHVEEDHASEHQGAPSRGRKFRRRDGQSSLFMLREGAELIHRPRNTKRELAMPPAPSAMLTHVDE